MKILNQKLLEYRKEKFSDPFPHLDVKSSAVVIPLYTTASGEDGILLTKRSEELRSHPGQISFPGGVHSPEEDASLIETALREWEEEVGVSRDSLQFLAPYKPVHTFTGYLIHPFVFRYSGDFRFQINQKEVQEMILVELDFFLTKPFYTIPNPRIPNNEGIYYLQLEKDILWGATCHILVHFLRDFADFQREPTQAKANLTKPPFLDTSIL